MQPQAIETPYRNAVTGSLYSANNAAILPGAATLAGHGDRAVAGFKQWLEVGRVVRKGEHGTKIYMVVDKKEETTEGDEKHKVLKMRTVFFESQTTPLDGAETTTAPTQEPARIVKDRPLKGAAFRAMAEGMQNKIDDAFRDRLENTPKRRHQGAQARLDGSRLKRTQAALLRLAALHDAETVPAELSDVTTKAKVYELVATVLDSRNCGYYDAPIDTGKPRHTTPDAVALWALLESNIVDLGAEALKRKVAAVRQSGIPGFFPTPPAIVERMIENVNISGSVLEPSAGDGAIADALRNAYLCANITLIEHNATLCDILRGKGHKVEQADFLAVEPSPVYDDVVMNPPFEGMADVDHVQHAYKFLVEGGRLVAVMSPGPFFRQDKKAVAFREWFESVGGTAEDLPAGSFKASGTSVSTKLVTIQR